MAAKILLVCASALFVQSAMGQYLGRLGGLGGCRGGWGIDGLAYDGLAYDGLAFDGLGYGGWAGRGGCGIGAYGLGADIAVAGGLGASYGGGLPTASASAIPPVGLSVASENVYEGPVAVAGNLPFLGTVAVEGVFPTAGAGAISYGCGDGAVGITAEGPIAGAYGAGLGYGVGLGYGAELAPYGLGYRGLAGRGCGCGAIY